MSEKSVLYFAIVVAIFILAISVVAMLQPKYAENDYQRTKASEIPGNKCATPSGYTDAQWREHMSHHPDQYAECLR